MREARRPAFARGRAAALVCSAAIGLGGCGGGLPLMHGAHAVPEGIVVGGAGVAGQVLAGDASTNIRNAQNVANPEGAPVPNATGVYHAGALALASLAPGVSPWVGARVGIGYDNEAGMTYGGRALRVDVRHAFNNEGRWAFSAGVGGSGVLADRNASSDLRGLGLNGVNGLGLDVPLLVGWRSEAEIIRLWAGLRGGYEHLGGTIITDDAPEGVGWSAKRLWAGGLAGLSVGFRHVWVALEFDAAYQHASATFPGDSVTVQGATLSPAGALMGEF